MTPVERLLDKLPDAKQAGKGWSACCPAHDDRHASLSVDEGEDGKVLLKCHAGCEVKDICAAMGLQLADLMPPRDTGRNAEPPRSAKSTSKSRVVQTYDYCDESQRLLFQAVRFEPKDFRQRRPKPNGGWDWSVKGVRVVPYRLPELMQEPTRPVVVVEGEKDVDNLARINVLATCNAGGAGKWTDQHSAFLQGRHVAVLPDNDEPGQKHAEQVAASLHGIAESVRIVRLPDLPPKADVSDWLEAGNTKDELTRLIQAAAEWNPTAQLWPEIVPFDELELPEFPTHALPQVLRRWVEAESLATQTPADLAGLLALAVCSALIARRVEVEPRPGWREPVNLFVTILLEPGNRKSAVFTDALRPLRELEAELIEAARSEVARRQSERRQDEARLKRLEKLAVEKNDAEASHEASNLAAELADQPEPVLPRLLVDDATSEKLAMILEQQQGRIASMSPEGGVFDLMAGLYSKSGVPQFGVYLMGHSGDDLVVDRVSRVGVRVKRPALTCAYTMQPQVIEGLAESAAFRGRGLLARFLYAAPQSWIGHREIAPPPVPELVRESYRQTIRQLADTEPDLLLPLAPDALSKLKVWESEIEDMLADGGQMELMRDWGAKLAGATLRLAAVLHCVEHGPNGSINPSTLDSAIAIAEYLIPHAETVLEMMQAREDSETADARYVLRWIERHALQEFTKRDAQQHGKRRFPKADDIDPALGELVRRGYIRLRPLETKGPGRPPSPTYEVNPTVLAEQPGRKCSQYSQNVQAESDDSCCENIENTQKNPESTKRVQMKI